MMSSNFCFPVKDLSNDRLKLTPFSFSLHSSVFFQEAVPQAQLFKHVPSGPFESPDELVAQLGKIFSTEEGVLFAVIDKTRAPSLEDKEGPLAGVIAYIKSSVQNLCTEIGWVITLPSFQRTHVTSNAVGLLLQNALEPTEAGGLGLRRVVWCANSSNEASIRVALRNGFQKEGILRWDRVFKDGEARGKAGNGKPLPKGGEKDLGRDTIILSLCWDDWEEGAREKVHALMNR